MKLDVWHYFDDHLAIHNNYYVITLFSYTLLSHPTMFIVVQSFVDSDIKTDDRASTRDSLVRSSMSCESFTSTLDLLDQHKDPSGLGQVEYSLQYHRYVHIPVYTT